MLMRTIDLLYVNARDAYRDPPPPSWEIRPQHHLPASTVHLKDSWPWRAPSGNGLLGQRTLSLTGIHPQVESLNFCHLWGRNVQLQSKAGWRSFIQPYLWFDVSPVLTLVALIKNIIYKRELPPTSSWVSNLPVLWCYFWRFSTKH